MEFNDKAHGITIRHGDLPMKTTYSTINNTNTHAQIKWLSHPNKGCTMKQMYLTNHDDDFAITKVGFNRNNMDLPNNNTVQQKNVDCTMQHVY